eukprot:CAMPEP_0170498646 /NCGR_PEP_ID=MMETSP0208-20121228/28509_1 /TAXON_ID=197538 /ORGANISM="Strombidium inclinatum, Strain S3" /LENGTH=46 /DNA_ID= /DNA_START= /DNA_END= /DNA_ORIENTATION=
MEEKNKMSHRAKALEQVKAYLLDNTDRFSKLVKEKEYKYEEGLGEC